MFRTIKKGKWMTISLAEPQGVQFFVFEGLGVGSALEALWLVVPAVVDALPLKIFLKYHSAGGEGNIFLPVEFFGQDKVGKLLDL